MKKGDFVLIFLALFLLAAAIWTIMFGGEHSRHGVGMYHAQPLFKAVSAKGMGIMFQLRLFCLQ